MSFRGNKTSRRILPRWRESRKAALSHDFSALKRSAGTNTGGTETLLDTEREFQSHPCVGTAADLFSIALLVGDSDRTQRAATFIVRDPDKAPAALLRIARAQFAPNDSDVGSEINTDDVYKHVTLTRALLRVSADNPALWLDMARHYASNGDRRRAQRAVRCALQIAPNHRWVLRTAARYFVHEEDPKTAHKLLASHSRTRGDPWLIAAELACAQVAGRPPKFWRQANEILKFDSVAPAHMSELATAVAMMELENGQRKKAKKLVQKGLIAPTENTLAQVFWAKSRKHLSDDGKVENLVKSVSDTFEVEFEISYAQGDLLSAIAAARIWRQDEPFAARPLSNIAYVSSLLDDYEETIRAISLVERLDGRIDSTLELNKIYAQLCSGRFDSVSNTGGIEHIRRHLNSKIEADREHSYHATANLALLEYRYGSPEKGKHLYSKAIADALALRETEAAAMAAIFGAREAILKGGFDVSSELELAKKLVAKADSQPALFCLRKLLALAKKPGQRKEILSSTSASAFIDKPKGDKLARLDRTPTGYKFVLPPKQR